jgi:hypothetical protein
LEWLAVRTKALWIERIYVFASRALEYMMILGSTVGIAIFASILFSVPLSRLIKIAPDTLVPYHQTLDREPGSYFVVGLFLLLILGMTIKTYVRFRPESPSSPRLEIAEKAHNRAITPMMFNVLVRLFALCIVAFFIIGAGTLFDDQLGSWAAWMDKNASLIIGASMIGSLLILYLLHGYRLRRWDGKHTRPELDEVGWTMLVTLSYIWIIMLSIFGVVAIYRAAR